MADRRLLLPEVKKKNHRLGRHINHDPRSLAFRVGATATPKTVRWERHIPVFDQGDLGSCTINALLGALGSGDFFATLPADVQAKLAAASVQTELVQPLYREETRLDSYPGAWEPDDTGSDGLSAAKTAQKHGWVSGYRHITSLGEFHAAIQAGPVILGTSWFSGMDSPTKQGVVTPTGSVRGGHEYEAIGYDADTDLVELVNSWSEAWGYGGHFFYSSKALTYLLSQQGDATTFVLNTQPAPTPTPTPPTPADVLAAYPRALVDEFAAHPRAWKTATLAAEQLKIWEQVAFPG
jgi:hypothetical protein